MCAWLNAVHRDAITCNFTCKRLQKSCDTRTRSVRQNQVGNWLTNRHGCNRKHASPTTLTHGRHSHLAHCDYRQQVFLQCIEICVFWRVLETTRRWATTIGNQNVHASQGLDRTFSEFTTTNICGNIAEKSLGVMTDDVQCIVETCFVTTTHHNTHTLARQSHCCCQPQARGSCSNCGSSSL